MSTEGREPVVLLHSGGMSSRQWRRLGEALAPKYDVIAPDFIGFGDNPAPPGDGPTDFHRDVDAITKRVEELGQPVHLVGHSYGGLIALLVAERHPSRIRSLTCYDPIAWGALHSTNDVEGLADLLRVGSTPVARDVTRGGGEEWFEGFVDYWNGPGAWRAMAPAGRDAFLRVGRQVFWQVLSISDDRTPASAYAKIEAPTLFLTGEHTPIAARHTVATLTRTLPNARTERIAGAGHMGPITHADEVNRLIALQVGLRPSSGGAPPLTS
jgi:pimeloyl-ACP methyl ester carboxylesterase